MEAISQTCRHPVVSRSDDLGPTAFNHTHLPTHGDPPFLAPACAVDNHRTPSHERPPPSPPSPDQPTPPFRGVYLDGVACIPLRGERLPRARGTHGPALGAMVHPSAL